MTHERLARIALLAYPSRVRAVRGEEMIGTLLDASSGSEAAFWRELVALIGGGLRARAAVPARLTTGRVIADGFCYAGIGMLALITAEVIAIAIRYPQAVADSTQVWELLLLAGCLSVALMGYDRIASMGALAWIAIVINARYRGSTLGPVVAMDVVPVVCFAVMLIVPRSGVRRVGRLAWLIPIAALGAASPAVGPGSYVLLVPLAIAAPVALARLPRDPRLAIACSVFAAEIAAFEAAEALSGQALSMGLPVTVLLFSLAPLAIGFAARRARADDAGSAA